MTGMPFFERGLPVVVGEAPGRLDVMGGIADYSGSLVLEMAIREEARVHVQRIQERVVVLRTTTPQAGMQAEVSIPLHVLLTAPERVRSHFSSLPGARWAAYAAGAVTLLADLIPFTGGARILVDSAVPTGAGMASSAALEVAALRAVAGAHGQALEPLDLALRARDLEHRIVGAPCGVMDQITAVFGKPGHLLPILCQPHEVRDPIPLPPGTTVSGVNSGVSHSVAGEAYGRARCAAFMGLEMLAALAGDRFGGFLANAQLETFENEWVSRLPGTLSGRDFLEMHEDTRDPMTTVDPDAIYPVRAATRHPIAEHDRAKTFAALLPHAGTDSRHNDFLGRLMYASHESYTACGLGSPETDWIVNRIREIGSGRGLFGARITGGGSGGTVAVLHADTPPAHEALHELVDRYPAETGNRCILVQDNP